MSDNQAYDWHNQQHRYQHTSNPSSTTSYGDSDPSHFGRVNDLDMRLFQNTGQSSYNPYAHHHSNGQLLSPEISYGAPEPSWPSDVDMGTPSTAHSAFANDHIDPFASKHSPLLDPVHTAQKPRSNPGSLVVGQPWNPPPAQAQQQQQLSAAAAAQRPGLHRAHTGPESRSRRSTAPATASPHIKSSESLESDEEIAPDGVAAASTDSKSARGRKRQRIPHTAVERRYRENLNAHLDRLRQAVPALAARRSSGSSRVDAPATTTTAEGVKPSKCEILSGAIEHIGALDRENDTLKAEVQALRARIQELERWYSGGLRAGPYP
ncbi:hypothetical protein K431DRAFT_306633 [Polychaeton citri CBS 116435]|uniref:BHLH domain-containing protein n=1 Tax=Polychaeton citri CBS 116435 TaxID=1314669 RepID=A0A9P4UMC5_9PEZI|nr:hypothetical protein K431DRAFT_306633 [Polychaeton citri CBS 116435]